jgi:hypothetical protein
MRSTLRRTAALLVLSTGVATGVAAIPTPAAAADCPARVLDCRDDRSYTGPGTSRGSDARGFELLGRVAGDVLGGVV